VIVELELPKMLAQTLGQATFSDYAHEHPIDFSIENSMKTALDT
jgi:hypothetical protein